MTASEAPTPSARWSVVPPAAVTAGTVLLVLAAERLPVPLVDWDDFRQLARGGTLPELTPLALGLRPFVLAFVLVECIAAAVPALRAHRGGSEAARAPLTRAAWALALGLAALEAWSNAVHLQSVSFLHDLPLVAPGLGNALAVASTQTLGAAAAGFAALVISRRGVGNGFAVLVGVASAEDLGRVARLLRFRVALVGPWTDVEVLVALAAAVVVPLVAAHRWRHRRRTRVVVPTCGLVPLQLAPMLLFAAVTALTWLGRVPDPQPWPGWAAYEAAALAVAVVLALVLSRLFTPAEALVAAFRRAASAPLDAADVLAIHHALSGAHRRSWALVAAAAALPLAIRALTGGAPMFAEHVLAAGIVLAVGVDLASELAARAARPFVPARALHRVHAAPAVLEALEAAGIPAFARGLRYRSLFHFFAPYAPIEIWVSPERVAAAAAICARVAGDPPAP